MLEYRILPMGKPRMTRRDVWKKRDVVVRYHKFKDDCRELGITVKNGDSIRFIMPMPPSWSAKKRAEMYGKPHTQVPDLDNLLKALQDATLEEDSHIHSLNGLSKVWGEEGMILIENGSRFGGQFTFP